MDHFEKIKNLGDFCARNGFPVQLVNDFAFCDFEKIRNDFYKRRTSAHQIAAVAAKAEELGIANGCFHTKVMDLVNFSDSGLLVSIGGQSYDGDHISIYDGDFTLLARVSAVRSAFGDIEDFYVVVVYGKVSEINSVINRYVEAV